MNLKSYKASVSAS